MMHAHSTTSAALPPPRHTAPTVPFGLEEYARLSCLPDADDDLVFEAGPTLGTLLDRVPRRAATPDGPLSRVHTLALSLIDGLSPVKLLVQLLGADEDTALVVVCDLYARGLIAFD